MDFRAVPEDHREAYRRLLNYAFRPVAGPTPEDDDPDRPPAFFPRGLYDAEPGADVDNEDLLVACAYYDFEALVRGDASPLGGVSAVASPPEHRRRGLVVEMLAGLHREFRDEGVPFAALWPFDYGFYRRLGYARVSEGAVTTVPAADLDAVAGEPAGEFERLTADDWAVADAVNREWATETLGVRRSEGFWRHRVFEGWETDPYVYAWRDDAGTPRGYVVYRFEEGDGGYDRLLRVDELAAVDDVARAQLYRFLWSHDSQVADVRIRGRADTRLYDQLDDPRSAEIELQPGAMARLVDVPAALSTLAYPPDAEGAVTVAVADDHCPWNDATFALTVADGTATCEETAADPDVTADVGTLTQVVLGSHGVEAAARDGRLHVECDAARRTLATLFPPTEVYLREGF